MDKHHERSNSYSDVNTHEQYQRSMQFIIQSVSKRYKILVLAAFITTLFTVLNHFFYLSTYEAKSVVRVQNDQKVSAPMLLASQQGMGYMSDAREMSRYIRYVQSEEFLTKVAQAIKYAPEFGQLDLNNPKKIVYFSKGYWQHFFPTQNAVEFKAPQPTEVKEIAAKIAQLVKIEIENVELLTFTVNSFNSQTSTLIANTYVEEFAKLNLQNDSQEIVEVEKFIKGKLEEVKDNLKKGEANMIALKERHHMYSTDSSGTDVSGQIKEIDRKQSELWIQQAENNTKLKLIQQNEDGPTYEQENEIKAFKIAELKKKNEDIARQRENLAALTKQAESKFSNLPKAEQEYFALKRQEQVDFDLYSSLIQKLNQLEIQKYSIQKKVIVETLAKSASPVARVNFFLKLFFGFFVSLFFGVVCTLILDWIDPTIKNADDLFAARIENIGVIPRIKGDKPVLSKKSKKKNPNLEEQDLSDLLITKNNPKSIESMSFKYIRARLQKVLDKSSDKSKVILVTSATSGDGKTFTSCNLAISFAQLGKRTLIIDSDFRHPSVNRYFEIPNRKGLASVLKMEHSLDDVMVQDETVPSLFILPADWGIEDPTELISDERMVVLLEHLKQEFDYIFIDSPPIHMVVDGLILSSLVSNVVLVGRYRQTLKRLLSKTYADLVNVNYQKIYGILNDAEQSKLLKFFGDHGMSYGNNYSYGQGKNQNKYYNDQSSSKAHHQSNEEVRAKKAS